MDMFVTTIDLPLEIRQQVITILSAELADLFDLYSQTKFCHWNLKGPQFIALHKMLDDFAGALIDYVDTVAERITALGGLAAGTVRTAATGSRVPEYPPHVLGCMALISTLAGHYTLVGANLRAEADSTMALHDMDTSNMLTDFSTQFDKWLWFMEAHTQK